MNYDTALENKYPILRADIESVQGGVYSERTDNQLAALIAAGDEAAFECVFERHKRRIATIAGRFFQVRAEVDEVIQVTFTKAYFDIGNFRGLHDHSLASWLRRIAVNVCLNRLKTPAAKVDKITAELSDFEMEAVSADLKEKSAEELIVQRDLLAKLLSSLNPEDRVLLQMLHGQEMSVADIAEIFGWSRAKVKVRAFRARRALNRMLKRFL